MEPGLTAASLTKMTLEMMTMLMRVVVVREMLMERMRVDAADVRDISAPPNSLTRPIKNSLDTPPIKIHLTPCHEGNLQ